MDLINRKMKRQFKSAADENTSSDLYNNQYMEQKLKKL